MNTTSTLNQDAAVLLAGARRLAVMLRDSGYRAQVKARKSGVYLSSQGHGNGNAVRQFVQSVFPGSATTSVTSGSYASGRFSLTMRILR